jgi:cyclomaltodextrinase / maltogenic alpha-amylase / neopullulanase
MSGSSPGAPGPGSSSGLAGRREPGWVANAIWWQVYPLGFTGADVTGAVRTPGRGLGHVTAWLDYAVELGASGLALGPVFASSTHGYDTIDHYRVDSRLGDEADFDRLVTAAHDRGLRVLLDGVFNHVGRDFPGFQRALAAGPGTPEAEWFRFAADDGGRPDGEPGYATFEGHRDLVALNHDSPAVADYVADVLTHWLDGGADGWRLDAAYAVPGRFWAEVLPRVRARHPDAYLAGEVLHGDYAAIVTETGLDAVTQYELWKAIWSSLNDRNFFELAWALDRHNTFLDTFVPMTFAGNHDVTRLASRLADERHLPHALVVLLTTGGTPSVYYGDEQAFRGVKEDRAGGDDAIRPGFPAGPADLAPDGWPTYRLHQDLIGQRRRHPWLHAARTRVLELTGEQLTYVTAGDDHRLAVALNLADSSSQHPAGQCTQIIAGSPGARLDGDRLTLPAHGWAIAGPG